MRVRSGLLVERAREAVVVVSVEPFGKGGGAG